MSSSLVFPDYSCALQRDILLQGRLYLSENWICFYSNIFRWETLVSALHPSSSSLTDQGLTSCCGFDFDVCVCVQLTVRLKDICSMTKEKTARLIPNAIQLSTDTEKVRN